MKSCQVTTSASDEGWKCDGNGTQKSFLTQGLASMVSSVEASVEKHKYSSASGCVTDQALVPAHTGVEDHRQPILD